jgi:hypothetical protein
MISEAPPPQLRLDKMEITVKGSANLWQCKNCGHKEWRFPEIVVTGCILCNGRLWPPNECADFDTPPKPS